MNKTVISRNGAFVEVSIRGLNHAAARRRDFWICLVAFGPPAVAAMTATLALVTWAVR